MGGLILILPVIIIATAIVMGFIISVVFKHKSNISIMLLGISIMIFGFTIVTDPSLNLDGFEYFISLVGLAFVISGFAKKENIN